MLAKLRNLKKKLRKSETWLLVERVRKVADFYYWWCDYFPFTEWGDAFLACTPCSRVPVHYLYKLQFVEGVCIHLNCNPHNAISSHTDATKNDYIGLCVCTFVVKVDKFLVQHLGGALSVMYFFALMVGWVASLAVRDFLKSKKMPYLPHHRGLTYWISF